MGEGLSSLDFLRFTREAVPIAAGYCLPGCNLDLDNGVHALTWTSPPFRNLYDRYVPEWRRDNFYLRYATKIPLSEVRRAHALAKRELLARVAQRTGIHLAEKL